MTANVRVRFSIARLMAAVLVSALAFALVRPFNFPNETPLGVATVLAIGMLVPIFVAGLTGLEIVTILAIAVVLASLLTPSVIDHHNPRVRAARAAARAAPAKKARAPMVPPSGDTAADADMKRDGEPR